MDCSQSNHGTVLPIPLKATVLLIWCQMPLKCFYPRKVCFFERTRKATHLKAGENFLPFTWVSETSIMQRHKHLTEWKIRGATLAGDQRASASGGIKQALSRSPWDFSPKLAYASAGRTTKQSGLAPKMWLKNIILVWLSLWRNFFKVIKLNNYKIKKFWKQEGSNYLHTMTKHWN